MQVSFKKLSENAVAPIKGTIGSAGFDLVATSKRVTEKYIEYGTGLSFEIPIGHVGLLFQRSSVSNKDLSLSNAVGVLDSDYRGEVTFRYRYKNLDDIYNIGNKIGQLIVIPYPKVSFIESKELTSTVRGTGGYGSTGL